MLCREKNRIEAGVIEDLFGIGREIKKSIESECRGFRMEEKNYNLIREYNLFSWLRAAIRRNNQSIATATNSGLITFSVLAEKQLENDLWNDFNDPELW